MIKIRKHIVVFLFCSFFSCVLSLNAMAYNQQACTSSEEHNKELVERDIDRIEETAGLSFKNCFGGLSLLEYQSLLQTLQNLESEFCAESAIIALETIRSVLQSDMLSEKKFSTDIGVSTIIGIPVGLPIYLLSELLYSIALGLQDSYPEIGIIFYFASIALAYLGMFFIL